MKKNPKTREVFVVQGYYGRWEDVSMETSYFAGRNRLREYNENETQYPHRLIKRRVPYFEISRNDMESNAREREEYIKRQRERRALRGK